MNQEQVLGKTLDIDEHFQVFVSFSLWHHDITIPNETLFQLWLVVAYEFNHPQRDFFSEIPTFPNSS